ncbi:MAG: hypothetical protein CML03_00940 [Pseudooceanicola sp.]|nr:hypothetical protein [Pseudooceanicola sp.]
MSLLIAPVEAITDPRLTGPERRVLLSLYSFRNKNADTVWPSAEAIAARSGLKDKTFVSKVTKGLAEKGWLTKKRRGYTGGNQYTLMVPVEAENHYSKLEQESNLELCSSLDENTNSNLEQESNSNLDYHSKNNEQQSEHQIEHQSKTSVAPAPEKPISEIADCPTKRIVDLYHEILPELPKLKVLTDARRSQIKARWREHDQMRSLEAWSQYFTLVRGSRFLMGLTEPTAGRKHFIASLEWLTKAGNFAKVIEGNYHDEPRKVSRITPDDKKTTHQRSIHDDLTDRSWAN